MIEDLVRARGGAAPRRVLLEAGFHDREISAAIRNGRLIRVRQGWYAIPTLHPAAFSAVTVGGRLTCGSALAFRKVWCFDDGHTHVALDPGARRYPGAVRTHQARLGATRGSSLTMDTTLEALERLADCAPRIGFLAAADSALNKGLVTMDQLETIFGDTTRGRRLLRAVDPGAQSGIETVVRIALRGAGVRLTSQITIPGVGTVDLLVGDRMVVECDGYGWHKSRDAFEEDRRRDLALTVLGYLPVRLGSRRILEDWTGVEADLRGLIRSDRHRWRGRRAV